VRADEKLTVFLELEAATAAAERRAQTSAPTRFEKGSTKPRKESSTPRFMRP